MTRADAPRRAEPGSGAALAARAAVADHAACFAYLYSQDPGRGGAASARRCATSRDVFAGVCWTRWLALMVPYSVFFLLIDSLVLWRVVNWFNARVRYSTSCPIRASAYILSILNEQVGKGAIALYLNRRDGVPGWQVGSSMLFIMFCEFFYLLRWATLGVALRGRAAAAPVFHALPWVAARRRCSSSPLVALLPRAIAPSARSSRERRSSTPSAARARCTTRRSCCCARPRCSAASWSTRWRCACSASRISSDMLGYLPVIFFGAAVPGPFRAVAITLWTQLFPEHAAARWRPSGCAAQLLRVLQRGDRAALPAPHEPRAFGAGA